MVHTRSRLVPIDEMARLAGVTVQWLRDEASAGRIPSLRVEHRLLFHAHTVEQILLERARVEEVVPHDP